MKTITSVSELRKSILLLEVKQTHEGLLLKEQLRTTYESLRLINIVKSSLKELISIPNLKEVLLSAVASLAAGYVSKKLRVEIKRSNPLKRVMDFFYN